MLEKMEPESVHAGITSPPYYGLRDFRGEPVIWNGDPACQHVWSREAAGDRPSRNHVGGSLGADAVGGGRHENQSAKNGRFCVTCGAWLGCLGREPVPEMYVAHLVEIMAKVRRVLRSDGTLWLNMGDSYAGGGRGGNTTNRPGVKQDTNKGSVTGPAGVPPGAKPKDLLLVPDMLALALRADGWVFRQKIIWSKPNPMPESVESRPTTSHEFIFLLAKSGKPQYWSHRYMAGTRSKPDAHYIWIDAADEGEERMKEPHGNWREEVYQLVLGDMDEAGQRVERRRWSRVNLWRGRDYYYDADAIREPLAAATIPRYQRGVSSGHKCIDGANGQKNHSMSQPRSNVTKEYEDSMAGSAVKGHSGYFKADGSPLFNPLGRNKRSVWSISTENFPGAHFATFPKKLVTPMILAATSHRACEHCAAPWARSVKKRSHNTRPGVSAKREGRQSEVKRNDIERLRYRPITEAAYTGWLPTCQCEDNGGSARCLVLDPFAGSGTTGVVAAIHGRDYMLFDTNEEYVQMARERIRREAAQMVMTL